LMMTSCFSHSSFRHGYIAKHKSSKHLKHRQEITWRKTTQIPRDKSTIPEISRKAALKITLFHHVMV